MMSSVFRACVVLATLLCAQAAVAQDEPVTLEDAEEPLGPARQPIRFSLELFGEHAFERDMGDGGTLSSTREGVEFSLRNQYSAQDRFDLAFRAAGVHHDFADVPRLFNGAENAESDLYVLRLSPRYVRIIDQQWSWFVGGTLQLTGGKNALNEDAFAAGLYAAGRKQINENLGVALGALVITRLEDDPVVAPYIGIDWSINDDLTFTFAGLGVELAARLDDEFTLRVNAQFDTEEFRLDDDTPIPDGVVQENWVDVGLGLDWSPRQQFVVSVESGIRVFDRFKTQTEDGDDVSADTADPTWYIGAGVTFRF